SVVVLLIIWAGRAEGHDPSAWGGQLRSRDDGATWVSANRGHYLSGAIALAVSPTDPNHLLLGAESGLFRSRNGGRDWKIEAPSVVIGSVFATAFGADGRRALISTGLGILRGEDDNDWRPVSAPQGAAPARAIGSDGQPVLFCFAGRTGLTRRANWGVTGTSAADAFPQEPVTAFLAVRGRPQSLYAIVQGQFWASIDGGLSWARGGNGISPANADALAEDLRRPGRL